MHFRSRTSATIKRFHSLENPRIKQSRAAFSSSKQNHQQRVSQDMNNKANLSIDESFFFYAAQKLKTAVTTLLKVISSIKKAT